MAFGSADQISPMGGLHRVKNSLRPTEAQIHDTFDKLLDYMRQIDKGMVLHPHDVYYLVTGVTTGFHAPGTALHGDPVISGSIVFPVGGIHNLFEGMTIEEEMAIVFELFKTRPYIYSPNHSQALGLLEFISVRSVIQQALGTRPHLLIEPPDLVGPLMQTMKVTCSDDAYDVPCYHIPAPLVCTSQKTITGAEPGTIIPFGRIYIDWRDRAITGTELKTSIIEGQVNVADFDASGTDPTKITYAYAPGQPEVIGLAIPIAKYFTLDTEHIDLTDIARLSSRQRDTLDDMIGLREIPYPEIGNRYSLQETIPISIPAGYTWKIMGGLINNENIGARTIPYPDSLNYIQYHTPSNILDGGWGRNGKQPIRTEIRIVPNPNMPPQMASKAVRPENKHIVVQVFKALTW